MNRLAGLLCVVLLALSLSVGNVEANGQVILDRIEPIKDDKITFLDPLKTDQGAIENIDTGSIDVTRQHELRVEVPNVSLTGLEGGVSIGGSLGVLLSSAYRDIAFEAANGHVQLTANQFHFTASENVVVESQAGDVTINSSLDTTLHGPSVNIYSRDGLTVDTQGNVLFSAGADLVVSTDDALTFQVQGLIDIEAEKGSFYNSAGGNLVISSSDYIRLDGPRGVSLDTSGTLSLVGAVEVDITGITTDVVSKGNIAISFPNVNVYGRDGVAIGGKAVNLTSRGDLSVTGLGPSAEILFDVGANLQLEAPLGSVNLETSGEATDISWWTATSLVNIGDDLNINTPTNVRIGSNLTDTFYAGTNIINWNSDNTYVTASGHLGTTSTGQTKYSARDIFSESYTYYEEATTGAITVIENSLSILSREGDPSHFVTIQSAGGITSSSSNKFTFGAYTIDGLFTNSQTYNVKDSTFTSTTDRDIIFGATQTETFTVEDDIDIVTKVAVFQGTDGENIRVDDFTINSDDFVSLASFYHLSTLLDITFTAGHQVNYAGTTLNDVSGGVIRVDADDNVILGAGDLSFTSALLNKIDMQDHVLYTVADDASLSTKATLRYDLSDSWYLKTSNFVLQGTQGITFTIAEWDGVFGSLAITSTDDALFDTKGLGFIEIYSGHNLDFLANLGLTLNTGDSINSLTQEITSFDAALSTLSFTTQGDFHIQGSGDMIWHANGNIFFGEATAPTSDSTVTSDIFRAGAGGQLSIVALDTVNFFQTDSYVHAQTDVQFFAVQGSLNIADQAEPADITLFGHVINEVTLQESTWTAGQRFGFSAVDFLMHSNSDLDITTSTSTIEGFTASFVGSSTSSVQGDTLYVVTGYDQYLHGVAGGTIDFTSRETQITSSSDIGFVSSGGAVSVTSKQDLTFQSILGQTLISANGAITAKAVAVDGNFGMNSAEDLAYYTNSGNIIHTARNVNFNTGQDFHVISQKADASLTTGCAVEFYTTDLSATFTTEVGELYLSGWEDFHIRSVIGALGSSGDVHVKSNGNSFFESQESALAYFARGVKGFSAQTNDVHYGNMELHAADADVWFFGSQGFVWNSDQDFYLLADDGMNITAAKTDAGVPGLPATISISSTDLSTIDGARGLIFVAGLDAPIVKADFSASSTQYTNLETYDQLHVRAAAGHFRVTSESSENVITEEQSQAKFSSAGDTLWTAGQDTTYTTIDGDQFFDANAFAINVDASRAVRVTTTEGPVVLRAIAGSFLLDGGNWELTSQMDSRFAALGFARLNAQASLRLISSSTNELDCVLLQNYRNLDSIFTNSKTTMTVTATTNGLTPRQEYSIQTIGDNIDFFAGNAIDLSSTGAFWVGNHTSPEIRITAGTGAVNGITSTSSEGTLARSQNTVTVVGNTFLYEVDSAFLESTGLIYLVSQAGANNINAHDSLTLNSEFLTADIVGNHVIDGQGTAAVRWTSEGTGIGDRMELRTTDLVQTSSDTINYVSSILYQLTLKGDYSVTAGGDISFQNIRPDDANYPKPFFSDIQTERGKEIWTVGDTWTLGAATDILVDLGRFGTPFTTNFTTGDFQQTSIDFDISGAFNWAAATYTIKAAYEGSTVQLQSTGFDLSADTSVTLQTVLPAKTGGYVHIDPLDSTINFRTLGFLSIDSTTSANYAAAGTLTEESLDQTTYSYTGDWNVLVTNNDQDSLVEFTSYESSVNFGNTVTSELTFDSTVVPNPFTNRLDTLYRSLYSSDAEVNYDFTDWTVDAGAAGRVQADASTIYLQPSTSLTATATLGKLILNTEEYQSDITVSSSGPLLFNPSALALFSSSDLLELRGTTTSTYTGADTTLTTGWGDISFDLSQDLKVVAAAAANILANGYDADNSRAFTLETNKLTATTTDDLYFLAKQGIEINSPDNTISFIAGILSLQSTNYVSPVVLNSVNSGITFAATTNNWAAGGVSLVESHDISLTAATALTIQAVTTGGPAIRDAGILFDTNPEQNMQSVISLTGDTAAHTAQWLTVSTDFTTADDGGIGIFTTGGAASVFNLQANDELNFLNNHGDMLFNLADAIVGSITTAVNIFSGSQVWNLGTGTMDSTASTVVRTGGSVFFNTPALLLDIADDLTLVTKEFGRSNDIYFRTESNIAFTSTGTTRFSGSGSDTDIVIEANADTVGQTITFFSSNSVSLFTRSGISLTTSEGTNTGITDINFSTQSTFDVTTSEWKANIFFQSDRDTIFRDLDGEIRHSNYHSRLGFFSVTPATIRLINLQGIEGCVRARFCGARTSGVTSAVWTSAIANVGAVATELHELIRTWGLVDWTTLIDKTSFLY